MQTNFKSLRRCHQTLERDSSSPIEKHFAERHYTVAEIAEMWQLSVDAVRRLFRSEPGVLILGRNVRARKRAYTTMRIPQSVLEQVHKRISLL